MLQTSAVIYCATDPLLSVRGKIQPGFEDFTAALEHAGVPVVWVSNRTRLQLDEPRRKLGHNHPFIGEGGSGVYLPEGYFHLRPIKTARFGRFICIPAAEPQPVAAEALEDLSRETGVPVVTLTSLSSRELMHNLGVPGREAEVARHRDFDELFFFAGSSHQDIERFEMEARRRKVQLRRRGTFWSLAVGASLKLCVNELSKLYDRALRSHPIVVGIATPDEAKDLFPACDRTILLTDTAFDSDFETQRARAGREIPISAPDAWDRVLESITVRR